MMKFITNNEKSMLKVKEGMAKLAFMMILMLGAQFMSAQSYPPVSLSAAPFSPCHSEYAPCVLAGWTTHLTPDLATVTRQPAGNTNAGLPYSISGPILPAPSSGDTILMRAIGNSTAGEQWRTTITGLTPMTEYTFTYDYIYKEVGTSWAFPSPPNSAGVNIDGTDYFVPLNDSNGGLFNTWYTHEVTFTASASSVNLWVGYVGFPDPGGNSTTFAVGPIALACAAGSDAPVLSGF